jgi:LuxR family transcriptional regulator, maltose regulon positive regulatory protein
MPDPVLIGTKLRPPAVRPVLVPRGRLVDWLASPRPHRLTLVDAPAGWGKTTLLAEWSTNPRERRPFAWVALDPSDNDPVRFWAYVIEALRTVRPGVGQRALAALRAPGTSAVRDVLPELVNDLAAEPCELVLAIDDYHLIDNREIHDGLELLVERLPPGLHLALATRTDPPLPLARMRARDQLLEIRSSELRFTVEEAAALLNDVLGLELRPADVASLQHRTEGWAAALCLAALSLRGRGDAGGFVAAFAGDDRHIVDYLGGEVLAGQPSELREFLLRTSILDRFCAPLCEAVTGRAGAAMLLEEAERANLFLIALDSRRRWYRYHHLFAELLRHELRRSRPELIATLHRRAAAWHRQAGSVPEAIHHATRAGDVADAVQLIANHWLGFFNRGELATVTGWLDALPAAAVAGDPRLCVARVWLALDQGRLSEADYWLAEAERCLEEGRAGSSDPGLPSGIALLRALHRYKTGDVGLAVVAARRAVDLEREGTPFWRTVASCLIGVALYWRGVVPEAEAALTEALGLAETDDNRLATTYSLGYLAALEAAHGDTAATDRLLERARAVFEAEPGVGEHFVAMMVHLVRAGRRRARGQLGPAVDEAARAVELARRGAGLVELGYATRELAELRHQAGDTADARRLLAESQQALAACADPGILAELVETTARRIAPARRRPPGQAPPGGELTERELAVLRLLPSGMSQREIGAALFLSQNTVKTHTRGIYRKLAATSRREAVAAARAAGLL